MIKENKKQKNIHKKEITQTIRSWINHGSTWKRTNAPRIRSWRCPIRLSAELNDSGDYAHMTTTNKTKYVIYTVESDSLEIFDLPHQ